MRSDLPHPVHERPPLVRPDAGQDRAVIDGDVAARDEHGGSR
jgi:hypothetical protein